MDFLDISIFWINLDTWNKLLNAAREEERSEGWKEGDRKRGGSVSIERKSLNPRTGARKDDHFFYDKCLVIADLAVYATM